MKRITVFFPVIFLCMMFFILPLVAFALDPGFAKGSLTVNGEVVQLSNGYALLHDNAEKVLDDPKELRILLTDREVKESTLRGLVFLEIEQMAKEGNVRGILLKLNPDNPNKFIITYLYPPTRPGAFLITKTISTTGTDAFKKFKIANGRITGELEDQDTRIDTDPDSLKFDIAVKFNVPMFNEPAITADLKGKEAKNSPHAVLLRKKADAMTKGDMKALQKLSSVKANKMSEAFLSQAGPEAVVYMKQGGAEMKKLVKKISRVVVRGDHAVMLFDGKQWANFVKEDGEWKSDD
ncbi:MAG: hypothetical protein HY754_02415 [Nitrospirae bacterium]|nr:hypothetical protein [Nitrospirota bacterium]